jgi:hypothetical protein
MCNEQVAGTRFAPHLEKCMNGGKRGSRKYNDALFDDSMFRLPTKPRVAEIPDPFPSSLVVKVRLKQGGMHIKTKFSCSFYNNIRFCSTLWKYAAHWGESGGL